MAASGAKRRGAEERAQAQVAPHPIPEGMEGQACPITGLFGAAGEVQAAVDIHEAEINNSAEALAHLQRDPDIIEERQALERKAVENRRSAPGPISTDVVQVRSVPFRFVPLQVRDGAHRANSDTRRLVRAAGGLPKLRQFTTVFYKKAFADPHLDQFIRKHSDPHGERFASWIVEKLGDGTPWTDERNTRVRDTMQIGNSVREVAFDRSSAHYAAWHSPKRAPDKWGQHFKPDDARVWMRLHFWSAREAGLFEHEHSEFMDYYVRFIGHFISVYSSKAPPFTRDSARWSADPQNIQRYVSAGNVMGDVIGVDLERALASLPPSERSYTGSRHPMPSWPYEL
jgi:hypothetical protein